MQTQKILRWGNSLAVRLPRNVAADLEVRKGSSVKLSLSRGRLIIEPAAELRLEGPGRGDLSWKST